MYRMVERKAKATKMIDGVFKEYSTCPYDHLLFVRNVDKKHARMVAKRRAISCFFLLEQSQKMLA